MQEKALLLIEKIRQHVITCCAVTMDPDDVGKFIRSTKKSHRKNELASSYPYL